MIKLRIVDISGSNYNFEDNNGNNYILNIRFYNIQKPKVGDYIYMADKYINEVNLYNFGPIIDSNFKEEDIIKIVSEDNEYYLERYYG